MEIVIYMIICLVLTIVIEIAMSLVLGVKDKKDLLNIVLVNILTNPLLVSIVNLINVYYDLTNSYIMLIMLELVAIFVEGYLFKKYLKYNNISGLSLSVVLNVCSYFIGYFVLTLIGY